MSWLAPAMFAALGALAIPLLLHLASAMPKDTVRFPSLTFLRRMKRRRKRLRRIRDPWLLAVRVLAVIALVLAFAEPILPDRAAVLDPKATPALVLVDRSASMSRLADFDAVRELARGAAADLAGRPLAVATFDTRFDLGAPFGATAAEIDAAVAGLTPGAGNGMLTPAVAAAGRLLADQPGPGGTLVLISDLQSAAADRNGVVTLPAGLDVRVLVPPRVEPEAVVAGARLRGLSAGRVRLELDVMNPGEADVTLNLVGATGAVGERRVPSGDGVRQVMFDLVRATDRDEPLSLSFDDADPSWFGVLPALPPRRVALLGGASPRETLFLARSLALGEADSIRLLTEEQAGQADVLVGALDVLTTSGLVSDHLARGGAVLALPPFAPGAVPTPDWLPLDAPDWHVPEHPARLASIDPGHPLAAALGGDGGTVAGARPIWRYLRGTPRTGAAQPLAFDDGQAALVVRAVGPGTVALLTAGAAPPVSELGLGEYFAPLVLGMVRTLTPRPERPVAHGAGEAIDLRQLFSARTAGALIVREPDGSRLTLGEKTGALEPGNVGHYRVRDATGERRIVAVNVPAGEWNPSRQSPEDWRDAVRALPSSGASAGDVAEREDEAARHRPLSVLLLFAALALFVVEAFVANHLTRRRAGTEVMS